MDRTWLGHLAGPGHSKGTLSRTGLPGRQDASLTLCGLVISHQDGEGVRRQGWGRHIGQGQETREGGFEWTALTRDAAWSEFCEVNCLPLLWSCHGQAGVIPPHSTASTKRVRMALPAHSRLISLAVTERLVCVCVMWCMCMRVCVVCGVCMCVLMHICDIDDLVCGSQRSSS